MHITSLELTNFKSHASKSIQFEAGSNLISGPNYSGKTTIEQAVLIGLFGNSMVPETTKELIRTGSSDFKIVLKTSTGLVVTRSSRDSTIARGDAEPFARGHTAVNEAMSTELSMDKNAFTKVFTSAQGSPQQLLQMEGADLQRFIEGCIGVEQLDETVKKAHREAALNTNSAEAVADRVLSPEVLSEAVTASEDHSRTLEALEFRQGSLRETLADNSKATHGLKGALESSLQHNQVVLAYDTKKSQMEGLETRPVVDLTEDNNELVALHERVRDQGKLRKHKTDKNRLEGEITELEAALFTNIPDLLDVSDYPGRIQVIKDQLQDQVVIGRIKSQVGVLAGSIQELAQAQVKSLPVSFDLKPLQDHFEICVDLSQTTQRLVDTLKASIEGSACPTCKRLYDDTTCLTELKQELVSQESWLEKQQQELKTAREDLLKAKDHNAQNEQHIRDNEDLDSRIESRKTQIKELESDLAALVELPGEVLRVDLENLNQELENATTHNTLVEKQTRSNENLQYKIDRVRQELASISSEIALITEEDQVALNHKVSTLEVHIQAITKRNADIEADNRLLARLTEELEKLQKPVVPAVDLEPLKLALKDLEQTADSQTRELNTLTEKAWEVKQQLESATETLKLHREAQDRFEGYSKRAKLYKSVATILADNRTQIVSEALSVIFAVASEFASLCTDGSMQEVLLNNGAISYRENGTVYGKYSASGAMKTIMGLGMKLGLVRLVRSNFSCLLLDEVSADMDEETSMRCMLALETSCGQVISISHRSMDTAGNAICL